MPQNSVEVEILFLGPPTKRAHFAVFEYDRDKTVQANAERYEHEVVRRIRDDDVGATFCATFQENLEVDVEVVRDTISEFKALVRPSNNTRITELAVGFCSNGRPVLEWGPAIWILMNLFDHSAPGKASAAEKQEMCERPEIEPWAKYNTVPRRNTLGWLSRHNLTDWNAAVTPKCCLTRKKPTDPPQ